MSGVVPTFFIGNENAADENKETSTFRRALPQFLAVGVKNMILFGYGMALGFPTILIPAIQGGNGQDNAESDGFSLSKDEISWISSINLLCVPIGCIFSGVFTEILGKRKAMQGITLPMLTAWFLLYFAKSTRHLYAGLGLIGIAGGLMEAPILTYVAEITQPQFRGMLAATGTTCVITGTFVEFILGKYLHWKLAALFSSILPVITFFALFFVPESPHWLLTRGRVDEARCSLTWLRGWVPFHRVETEFNEIYDALNKKRIDVLSQKNDGCFAKIAPYTKKSFFVPFALISATFFIGHFGGKTPLQTYAVQIFSTLKAPIDKYYATIFLGAAELVGCIICVILVHITGKRPLVFISTIGAGLCFLGTAVYAKYLNLVPGTAVHNVVFNASAIDLGNATTIITEQTAMILVGNLSLSEALNETAQHVLLDLPNAADNIILWLPLTLLLLSALFAHVGIIIIPWMLIGEIFPNACRSGASGFASGIGYMFGFLANKLFLQTLTLFTLPGTFWLYSAVSLLGCVILYFILPETEGRTLIEIEEHFSGGRNLLESKVKSVDIDRGFDHITVLPAAVQVHTNKQQDIVDIPEHIKNSTAIGMKRNVKKTAVGNDDEQENGTDVTQF